MKQKLLFTLCGVLAALTGRAQGLPVGKLIQQDGLAAVITLLSCDPIPGVPLGPSPDCQPGVMISVRSSDATTVAMVISIKYRDANGALQSQAALVPGAGVAFSSTGFSIGSQPVLSLAVTELRPSKTVTLQ